MCPITQEICCVGANCIRPKSCMGRANAIRPYEKSDYDAIQLTLHLLSLYQLFTRNTHARSLPLSPSLLWLRRHSR